MYSLLAQSLTEITVLQKLWFFLCNQKVSFTYVYSYYTGRPLLQMLLHFIFIQCNFRWTVFWVSISRSTLMRMESKEQLQPANFNRHMQGETINATTKNILSCATTARIWIPNPQYADSFENWTNLCPVFEWLILLQWSEYRPQYVV
jgi:hypothetical protein